MNVTANITANIYHCCPICTELLNSLIKGQLGLTLERKGINSAGKLQAGPPRPVFQLFLLHLQILHWKGLMVMLYSPSGEKNVPATALAGTHLSEQHSFSLWCLPPLLCKVKYIWGENMGAFCQEIRYRPLLSARETP